MDGVKQERWTIEFDYCFFFFFFFFFFGGGGGGGMG